MINQAIKTIKEADYLLITAGAGMGVDSGLPDFRGVEGFWKAYPIAKKLGLRFEELANPMWFKKNSKLAWAFYGHRLNLYRETKPHEGFYKLLEIAKSKKDYFIFTSNVDGQFQKAGFSQNKIYEVHGSIHHLQCTKPCCNQIWSAKDVKVEIDNNFQAKEPLPKCKYCDAIARPNILMFGDWNWLDNRAKIQEEQFASFLNKAHKNLAIIEFGAGVSVPTVRLMGQDIAKNINAKLIRVNPREAYEADISLEMGAKEAIEWIYQEVLTNY